MNCKSVEFDFIEGTPGKTSAGNNDWDLAQTHATFHHKAECEFIFFIK